jgi:hypothetical protein
MEKVRRKDGLLRQPNRQQDLKQMEKPMKKETHSKLRSGVAAGFKKVFGPFLEDTEPQPWPPVSEPPGQTK